MVNISTGHKAKSADLVRVRGIGMGTAPVASRETGSAHKTGHICRRVFLFRKLAFPLVNCFAVSVLGAILCRPDSFPESLNWGPPHSENSE